MLDHLVTPPEGTAFPAGMDVALVTAPDGLRLRMAFLPSGEAGKGTVFVLQGRAEFIEKYGEVFTELHARGFSIATLDWRGQGGSERQLRNPRKGHIEDFDDYLLDLETLVAEAERRGMPKPFGVLAHSTGACIALVAAGRGETRFRRMVMTAPLTGIAGLRFPGAMRILARTLTSIGLSTAFVPGGGGESVSEKPFEGNVLTGDPGRYASAHRWLESEPSLAIGDPTVGWADAAFDVMAGFQEEGFGRENRAPILMVLAGADQVVDTAASEALAQRMREASAIILSGARHEILMERDEIRARFWATFDAFMRLDVED
ncbi:MAG TPA: alpha/beta hydrolase [Rhabdaerophilum sp.]|nr:alpha/beta hydrolase [Rhabdaerophilum sp.]